MKISVELRQVEEIFSKDEVDLILQFSKCIGLDIGVLDVLRDINTGKLYIIDVNNTPPGPPKHLKAEQLPLALERLCSAFKTAFIK